MNIHQDASVDDSSRLWCIHACFFVLRHAWQLKRFVSESPISSLKGVRKGQVNNSSDGITIIRTMTRELLFLSRAAFNPFHSFPGQVVWLGVWSGCVLQICNLAGRGLSSLCNAPFEPEWALRDWMIAGRPFILSSRRWVTLGWPHAAERWSLADGGVKNRWRALAPREGLQFIADV